jgi:type II restriction/modification system DNA methylase subunit YeeA
MVSNGQTNTESRMKEVFFCASASDFRKIPGSPIAYWFSDNAFAAFSRKKKLKATALARRGLSTGDNEKFVRYWYEVALNQCAFGLGSKANRWFPYNKGGDYRKWFGNNDLVVNWENNGANIKSQPPKPSGDRGWRTTSEEYYLKPGITWTGLTAGSVSFRRSKRGFIFDTNKGPMMFPEEGSFSKILGFLNSRPAGYFLGALNPTMSTQNEDIDNLPFSPKWFPKCDERVVRLTDLSEEDWDAFETSWEFSEPPLLSSDHQAETLELTYASLRAHCREMTLEMQELEEENNRVFIEAYGLHAELTSDVPLEEITLTCNPYYRYGNNKSEEELESLLLADTMRDLVSYSVGCMFGRYALDKPGLVLANQGETIEDYLERVPEPSFPADDDNVIPMLDGDWFTDDITERFREFLRIAFGEEHYDENLRFVEQALGKDIRKYFLKDFYNDHVRRYKKRPIYWLFSSPKGSFNALIYMHRYQPHTVGTVLEYLRDFKDEKLKARKNHLEAVSISAGSSQGDKTKALKEIEKINKILAELDDYERDVLYPLATEQVEIDLDDGVKTNYPKFGEALKKITGLSG